MNPSSITRLIFDTIPQVYEAEGGDYPVQLRSPLDETVVYSVLPLSDDLKSYLEKAVSIWAEIEPMTEGAVTQIIEREWIQQKFAVAWLESRTALSNWTSILDYFARLARRTVENKRISKSVVIEPGERGGGTASLTDERYFKVFDWLGSTPMTYYRVDRYLGIKALEAVSLTGIKDLKGYRFYPDRLHPVLSSLKDRMATLVYLSEEGALLIANWDGVIASKGRQGDGGAARGGPAF